MGVDLTVSERTDYRTDEKGRTQYTVTLIYNFERNAYKIIEYTENLAEMANCTTVTVNSIHFIDALKRMKDDMLFIEHDGEHYANEERELKYAIDDLESFIDEFNLTEDEEDRIFEVHLWF